MDKCRVLGTELHATPNRTFSVVLGSMLLTILNSGKWSPLPSFSHVQMPILPS